MGTTMIVVGVGDFGRLHAEIAWRSPEIDLIGVVDSDRDRALAVAECFGVRPYVSLSEALSEESPSAAIVATPESIHCEQVLDCLRAGIHVLVEKPVATTSGEIWELQEAASQEDLVVLPGHVSRFLPEVHALLQYPGNVWSINASRLVPWTRRALHGRIHPAWMAMIHDVDLVAALMPATQLTVSAHERRSSGAGVHPDMCWAMIAADDGPVALVENVWLYPHDRRYVDATLRVVGDDRVISVSLPSNSYVETSAEGEYRPFFAMHGAIGIRSLGALTNQLEHFLDAVAGRAQPLVTLEDAHRSARIVEAIVQSAASGKAVRV